ncbi:hypothetical protein [Trabulsiella guamensis]|nr:hypothetical protein [Trabulsiella guamensis]
MNLSEKKIADATKEQTRLNSQLKRAEALSKWASRGAGAAKFAGGTLLAGGGLLVAGATSVFRMNAETAEQDAKARAYGVDQPTFQAWEGIAKRLGLNGENVGDLPEEMAHKIGEYKETGKMGAVEDAFTALGFTMRDMDGLSNQEQFEKIMDKAAKMKDFQKASFVVDDLMGGEASKFLQLMRQTGKTWKELENEQKKYIMTTEEGAAGATASSWAMDKLMTVFSSGLAEVSGLLGKEMAPSITNIADKLAGWFKNGGIEKIKSFITDDLVPGLFIAARAALSFGRGVVAVAKKLDWLLPDEKDDKREIMRNIAHGDIDEARELAKEKGLEDWITPVLNDPEKIRQIQKANTDAQFVWSKERFTSPGDYWDNVDDRAMKMVGLSSDTDSDSSLNSLESAIQEQFKKTQQPEPETPALPENRSLSLLAATAPLPQFNLRSEPKISATYNIYQQPGEDGEALARRVNDEQGTIYTKYADQVW